MKKAIVIGASSGIGRALAKVLSENGYTVGLTARRFELLESLQTQLNSDSFIKRMDVSQTPQAMNELKELIQTMSGVDLIVINAGTGFINQELDWDKEKITIETNVAGFAALANIAVKHFIEQGSGHLVGISSIAALKGNGGAPAYNASKAFMSNYMEGLRHKVSKLKLPISITDIQPGFVDTDMAKADNKFWVASPEKAAGQIYDAIKRKKKHAYVSKRWRLIAWLFKIIPDYLYNKI